MKLNGDTLKFFQVDKWRTNSRAAFCQWSTINTIKRPLFRFTRFARKKKYRSVCRRGKYYGNIKMNGSSVTLGVVLRIGICLRHPAEQAAERMKRGAGWNKWERGRNRKSPCAISTSVRRTGASMHGHNHPSRTTLHIRAHTTLNGHVRVPQQSLKNSSLLCALAARLRRRIPASERSQLSSGKFEWDI